MRAASSIYEDVEATAFGPDLLSLLRENGKRILADAAALPRRGRVAAETAMVERLCWRPADVIVEQAKKLGADLIVIGTHGRRGIRRLVLGSDAEQVLRTTPVPVLLVRAQAEAQAPASRSRGGKTRAPRQSSGR